MTQKIVRVVVDGSRAHQATPSMEGGLATQQLESPPQVRLAHTAAELTAAYRLVHDQYVKRGYQATNPKGVHFTPHFALPTSHTFIAFIGTAVAGTITMTIDGALGLPMEQQYPDEIRALRKPGHRLAELSCLVTRRSTDLPVLLCLFHAAYAYALRQQGVTDFCIAVTTEHQRFICSLSRLPQPSLTHHTMEKTLSSCASISHVPSNVTSMNIASKGGWDVSFCVKMAWNN